MTNVAKNRVELITDGACSGNPGPGGWGVILRWRGEEKEFYGGAAETTNNRMEMQAVIEGLSRLKRPCQVTITTDSKYVADGMTKWLDGWKAKDYRVKGGALRKNHDLWKRLDELARPHDITWNWVKGHAGHADNERADQLATRGSAEAAVAKKG